MNILITNDDGINACGLEVLVGTVRLSFSNANITVFAPAKNISGAGRSLTFGDEKLVRVDEIAKDRFAVHGTPCDCVDIACRTTNEPFDLCFSGINHGYNLGNDLYLSGTAQAAQYAWDYFHIASIAFSSDKPNFEKSDLTCPLNNAAKRVIQFLWPVMRNKGGMYNVNFPQMLCPPPQLSPSPLHCTQIVQTKLGIYRAIGPLTPKQSGCIDPHVFSRQYDLLEAMNMMEASEDDPTTDAGAVKAGYISVNTIS